MTRLLEYSRANEEKMSAAVEALGQPPADIADSILSVTQLMALDIPERKLLFPWLPQASIAMVFGPPGVGKTYFTLSLAVSLAHALPFMKWEAPPPTGVLYVDGEMPLSLMKERLLALSPGKSLAPLEIFSHEKHFEKTEKDLQLCDASMQAAVQEYLEGRQDIGCLILDNLSCLLPTVREDKRDEWATRVLPFLLWLRRRRIAVVLCHHTGHDESHQRGTSSRRDALDIEIRLQRVSDESEGAHFSVNFTKCRGVYGDAVAPFEAHLSEDAHGRPQWECVAIVEGTKERLFVLVQDGVTSVKDAAEALGVKPPAVSKAAKKLREEGRLGPGPELKLPGRFP